MQYTLQDRRAIPSLPRHQALGWRITSATLGCLAVCLATGLFVFSRNVPDAFLLSAALTVLGLIALLHARFLQFSRLRFLVTSRSLAAREQEFRSVFEGALDAILVLDDQMVCQEANPSAFRLFCVERDQLVGRSLSLFEADHGKFFESWQRLVAGDVDRGQMEMMRADGARLAADFTATANMLPGRHLLVLRDATERLRAEEVRSRSLAATKAALQEAHALRSATLALTQALRLNPVLDTLLVTLRSLIPYETAQVLLLEASTRLFLAREVSAEAVHIPHCTETVDCAEFPVLQQALLECEGLLIRDTRLEIAWRDFPGDYGARSWLGVPLYARDQVIGLLSVMHTRPEQFTAEHLRLAGSLAIPATVAIENARLYERAEICSAELEKRLGEVRIMGQTPEDGQQQRGTR